MPELPPPPPPPLSLAGVLVDASRRWLGRAIGPRPSLAEPESDDGSSIAPAVPPLMLVMGVALLVVLLVAGGWVVLQRAGRSSAPPEVALPRAAPRPAAADAVTDGAAGTAGAGDERIGPVTVHAAGAVAQPGVYRLPAGARVADLVQAAGGAAGDAEIDALNLAAPLSDGQRVYVPHRGELAPGALLANATGSDASGSGTGPGPPERPVDLNTATLDQLDALPGVGPTTAQAILDFRRTNGKFRSVEELLEVRGIGPSRLQALRKKVRV